MEEKEYLLLEYLAQFDKPVKIVEEDMTDEIRANFEFLGLDKNKYPNSIYVELFKLARKKFVDDSYADMYAITNLGRTTLQKHQERNRPQLFAKQCDAVLQFIISANKRNITHNTQEISDELKIEYDTVEAIADEFEKRGLIQLSGTNFHYNFHVLPAANSFARRTSFSLEKEQEFLGGGIHNSFNKTTTNTTHGAQSPIISDGSSQSVSYQEVSKPVGKKGLIQAVLEYFKNPIVSAVSAFVVTASGSLLIVGPCNPTRNDEATLLKAKTETSQDTIRNRAKKNAHSYP